MGASPVAPTAVSKTMKAGPIAVSFMGQTPSLLTQSNSETVVEGLCGSAFTGVTLTPPPSTANTLIAYDGNSLTYDITPQGTNNTLLSTLMPFWSTPSFPSCSSDGRVCSLCHEETQTRLIVMNADGSNQKTIYTAKWIDDCAWQPRSQKIIFAMSAPSGHYQIYAIQSNGTGLVQLSDGTTDDAWPAWSADGTKITFSRIDATGHYQVYVAKSDLSSIQSLSSLNLLANFSSNDCQYPAFSPDGNSVVFVDGAKDIYRASLVGNGMVDIVQNGNWHTRPSFSPDGKSLAFGESTATGSTIVVSRADGSDPYALPIGSTANASDPNWSPFPTSLNYVGTSGIFGNTSSGFLVGEVGQQIGSVLSFAATTPSSATVTGSGNGGAADLVFTITADAITKFVYVNHLYSAPITVIPVSGTTSAQQALVTFDGQYGTVNLVIPVAGKARGSHLPPAARHGNNLTYTGQFLAIYDKDGKNLANQGASSITVNGKTGRLVEFR